MKRSNSIKALLKKAEADFKKLRAEYDESLHEKHVREDLKIAIKNIFENLRSCLDYMAHDIFESHCSGAKKPSKLYFPICQTEKEFNQTISKNYPSLSGSSGETLQVLKNVQPFTDPWLGQFSKLNNHNKHQDLVEQTRTEQRQVTVSREEGSVSWGPSVTFGPGVSVMGVPIDPRTQMPEPNNVVETEVVIWVYFRFAEIDKSVLPFIENSINNVRKVFEYLEPHV